MLMPDTTALDLPVAVTTEQETEDSPDDSVTTEQETEDLPDGFTWFLELQVSAGLLTETVTESPGGKHEVGYRQSNNTTALDLPVAVTTGQSFEAIVTTGQSLEALEHRVKLALEDKVLEGKVTMRVVESPDGKEEVVYGLPNSTITNTETDGAQDQE